MAITVTHGMGPGIIAVGFCLAGETPISTPDGYSRIDGLKPGDMVMTGFHADGRRRFDHIVHVGVCPPHYDRADEYMAVETMRKPGLLRFTKDHLWTLHRDPNPEDGSYMPDAGPMMTLGHTDPFVGYDLLIEGAKSYWCDDFEFQTMWYSDLEDFGLLTHATAEKAILRKGLA